MAQLNSKAYLFESMPIPRAVMELSIPMVVTSLVHICGKERIVGHTVGGGGNDSKGLFNCSFIYQVDRQAVAKGILRLNAGDLNSAGVAVNYYGFLKSDGRRTLRLSGLGFCGFCFRRTSAQGQKNCQRKQQG